MQILYSRCCGIDVHKDSVTACVLVYADGKEPEVRRKEFQTHFKALGNLRFWLFAQKVTHVAMESTGVYWKPIWQALEGHFELILANPYQVKTVPGKKTDVRDSQWLAELLAPAHFCRLSQPSPLVLSTPVGQEQRWAVPGALLPVRRRKRKWVKACGIS
jgi:transposase